MTPELKTKWLGALRSGKYEQGHHHLHEGNKFCCLGVLCDIAGYEWKEDSGDMYGNIYTCPAGTNYIEVEEEQNSLGLPERIHRMCYDLNDGTLNSYQIEEFQVEQGPHSFSEIADFLEKNL